MSTLTIEEKVDVNAPVAHVWAFLLAPEKVVACLPGAGLDEVIDARTFTGNVKVKVGPVSMTYAGKAKLEEVDESTHSVTIVGEGKEKAGADVVKMTLLGHIDALPEGGSTLSVKADVLLTGKIVRFGRGMIEAVSAQMFKDFAARMRSELESNAPAPPTATKPDSATPDSAPPTAPATPDALASAKPPPPAREQEPINGVALFFRAVWSGITGLFRRLLGKSSR
jgi:carbon monoxide dehydrogenase subunit G